MSDIADRLTAALADRYRIERELGQGGMATVYLAEDLRHHRKVAVKVLRPELAVALGPERLLLEIAITAQAARFRSKSKKTVTAAAARPAPASQQRVGGFPY